MYRSMTPASPIPSVSSRTVLDAGGFAVAEVIGGDFRHGMVILCDHARNALPAPYGSLGLDPGELARHIAFDIGAEAVTRALARRLGAPAVLCGFSRLLIDPNRGLDDPTLIMMLSDGAIVPANARMTAGEREQRIARFYRPYHESVSAVVAARPAGTPFGVVSIHSFTPYWKGAARPWHAGVLWAKDRRLAGPVLAALAADQALVVGENQPYAGGLEDDTLDAHAIRHGIPHALVEIRQDLIATVAGAESWAGRLADILPGAVETLGGRD
jgi:predicted N-formylglutamate amidohydrolase